MTRSAFKADAWKENMRMKRSRISRSAFFIPCAALSGVLCLAGVLLTVAAFNKSGAGIPPGIVTSQSGTWKPTGSMNVGRASFTATLLFNGKVLVAGGCTQPFVLCHDATASAELYDPSTGRWTPIASMTTPRASHTATLLPSGKVLVTGGENNKVGIFSTELYDPYSETWTSSGRMNTPRVAHTAALISGGPLSGMVLVAGGSSICAGCTPILDSAELYDPSTGVWSYTGSMALARALGGQASAMLPDGSVIVLGGVTCCPYHLFNDAERYDLATQKWTPTGRKTTNANGAAISLSDGRVFVAGGARGTQPNIVNVATAELFDVFAGTWIGTGSMSTDRSGHTLTLLESHEVLAAGGYSGGGGICNDLTSTELYDPSAGTWFLSGPMTTSRSLFTATLLSNGQVLAVGGEDCEGHRLSSAELYTPPPVAAVSTSNLTFSIQRVGTQSRPQIATLTNIGTTPLAISGIAASSDFLTNDNCGSNILPGESCIIKVVFSPTDKGDRAGELTITDNAADGPQVIKLTGIATVVELTPKRMDLGEQKVGRLSSEQAVILANTGSTPLSIHGIRVGGTNFGDFLESATCEPSVPANSTC